MNRIACSFWSGSRSGWGVIMALVLCLLAWMPQARGQQNLPEDPRVEAWAKAAEVLPQNCSPADLISVVKTLSLATDAGRIAKPKEVVRCFVEATTNLDEAKAFLAAAEKVWPGIGEEAWAKDLVASPVSGYTYPRLILNPSPRPADRAGADAKAADEKAVAAASGKLNVVSFLSTKNAEILGIAKIKVEVTLKADPSGPAPGGSETFSFDMYPVASEGKVSPHDFPTKLLDSFNTGSVTFKYTPVAVPDKAGTEKAGTGKELPSVTRVHHMRYDPALGRPGMRHYRQCPNPELDADAAAAAWALRSFYDDQRSPDPVPAPPVKKGGRGGKGAGQAANPDVG